MKTYMETALPELNEKLYLERYPDGKQDLEIMQLWEQGATISELSAMFYRSKSSLYRIRDRVRQFTENPFPKAPYQCEELLLSSISVPEELMICAIACGHPSAYLLFLLAVGIYRSGAECRIPRQLMMQISPSLGRRRYALQAAVYMEHLRVFPRKGSLYPVFSYVSYTKGLAFRFSERAQRLLDASAQNAKEAH